MCKSKPVTTDHKYHTPQFQQQSGTQHNVHVAQPQEEDHNVNHIRQESDDTYIFNIQSNNKLQKYPVTINNTEIMMLIDSGATLNILDESSYNLVNPAPPLKSTNVKIFPYQATTPLKIQGTFQAIIRNEQNQTAATFYVTTGKLGNLLSKATAELLNQLRVGLQQQIYQQSITKQYQS